ncbi:TPA: hydroxyacid dehydrogenase [Candidatus Kaiserbacteria bacterium]|nr:MAG: D-isomer specific 2-hydroxyacid dehydrogenase NAD-binding protein [Parcubacteria group bacterium GW2011_GWA1_56_13]KKW46928.1 MAG: D-isomer specific 2-hydroxyacid dehydrogenase NAD-binding protein [Parcubacteria group bacterium GW2011_GWB1_57_6]HCR52603.1 hydroxyacid dehydrogenase [Candidatus Kaiserbacteria bacterium]
MKIRYFSGELWEESYVRAKLPNEDIFFHAGPLATFKDLSDADTEVLCTFIESRIGADELKRFPGLKLIATRSTGFDHIDLKAAAARGVVVANVPYYGEHTVAEFAFALLLALSRRVIDADERVRETGTFSHDNLRGFDLAGKTIGIVGCGHIGIHAIRMANGFGMNVLGFDVRRDDELARTHAFSYAELPELLAASDIVSLHVPYNKHTHHLINRENVDFLKKGAYLINTSRGAVVETQALIDALQNGTLAGAGLDVLEEEGTLSDETALLTAPHPNKEGLKLALENHYLIRHPRVIVTPHTAFNTTEAVERILDATVDNIRKFEAGSPTNIVS